MCVSDVAYRLYFDVRLCSGGGGGDGDGIGGDSGGGRMRKCRGCRCGRRGVTVRVGIAVTVWLVGAELIQLQLRVRVGVRLQPRMDTSAGEVERLTAGSAALITHDALISQQAVGRGGRRLRGRSYRGRRAAAPGWVGAPRSTGHF